MKKTIAALAAFLATAGLLLASFSQVVSSNQQWSGSVTVPTAANCQQFAAAYHYSPYDTSYTINNGPLGSYTLYENSSPNYISVTGPVGAGTYSVFLYNHGSGYSGCVISW